jgi:formylglycine-generating enzyme required for sulfatase activity
MDDTTIIEPQMVQIPAGKFLMGMKGNDQKPQREVELSEYSIGKYPVTNREYQAFVQDAQYDLPSGWENGKYPGEKGDYPVVGVSWHDAQAYCRWLSQKTGKQYRLPTEAEWEKAAGGTDGRIYPWGDNFDPKKCNVSNSKIGGTTRVGRFSAVGGDSPYGCADMAGNVEEWCYDWIEGDEHKNSPGTTVKDPQGPETGTFKALRGGSSFFSEYYARVSSRNYNLPHLRHNDFGFRVALSPS